MLVDQQVAAASSQRQGLAIHALSDGTRVVSYEARLAAGWSKPLSQIRFVLPVPYPAAQPDCFFADSDLRLANGAMPVNTGMQPLNGVALVWFSWHLTAWSPQQDNLLTYIRFIESRLRDAR